MEDGGSINGIYFRVPNALGVVYYLKGNSKSIKGWGKFAKDYLSLGYDFFMMAKAEAAGQKIFSTAMLNICINGWHPNIPRKKSWLLAVPMAPALLLV